MNILSYVAKGLNYMFYYRLDVCTRRNCHLSQPHYHATSSFAHVPNTETTGRTFRPHTGNSQYICKLLRRRGAINLKTSIGNSFLLKKKNHARSGSLIQFARYYMIYLIQKERIYLTP